MAPDLGIGPVVLGSVCTGYGGLDLGVLAALNNTLGGGLGGACGGGRVAWCADPDPHVATILAARMPGVPNLGDVRAIDWHQVEPVDVLTAGFPCQDISAAGRRAGIEKGVRSGLWTDIVAGVRVLRPALVVVENVAALRWRHGGLHRVLGDLAEAGYDALWRSVRAADIGAAHRRERVFLLAWHRTRIRTRTRAWTRRGKDGDASNVASGIASDIPGDTAAADRARRFLERCLGGQQAGRSLAVGPAAAAAHPDRVGREELHTPHTDRWALAARPSPSCPRPAVADPGRGRLPLRGDPDGAHPGAPHPDGVRDPHRLGSPTAHPASNRHRDRGTPSREGFPAPTVTAGTPAGRPRHVPTTPDDSVTDTAADAVADAASDRRDEGLPGTARLQRRPDAALSSHPTADPAHHPGHRPERRRRHLVAVPEPAIPEPAESASGAVRDEADCEVDWGVYTPAVRRWERVLGRPAPFPTQPGRHGRPVLAPAFVEWLQGLEPGWVTSLPLPRTAQLRALGNGVVPQQAAYAVALLLADLAALLNDSPSAGQQVGEEVSAA